MASNDDTFSQVINIALKIILLYLLANVLAYIVMMTTRKNKHLKNQFNKICLVIAHPDDECLFFGPTIRAFLKENIQIYILCLSNGNYYGQGKIRERELQNSCLCLSIKELPHQIKSKIVNSVDLQDHPTNSWNTHEIINHVDLYLDKHCINTIVTFDKGGISGHSNHCDIFKALSSQSKNIIYLSFKQYLDCNSKLSISAKKSSKNLFIKTNSNDPVQKNKSVAHYRTLDSYSKHKKLINDYMMYYSKGKSLREVFKRDTSLDKTDLDVIREEMRFVWDESDEATATWEKRLAKKYYDKLFKEYCICDLSLYKLNKVAMRWRVEKEVVDGKGQFICGDKKCDTKEDLKSWEVNFGYNEAGEKKNALVKLRLCSDCSKKLNFHHKKKEIVKNLNQTAASNELEKTLINIEEKNDEDVPRKKQKVSSNDSSNINISEKITLEDNMIILHDDSVWKQRDKSNGEKSRDEEFENYLEDLLL